MSRDAPRGRAPHSPRASTRGGPQGSRGRALRRAPPIVVRRRSRLGGRLADGREGVAADAHSGRLGVPPRRFRGAGGFFARASVAGRVVRQVPRRVRHGARPASVRGPLRAGRGGAAQGPGARGGGVRGRVRDQREARVPVQQLGGRGDGARQAATLRETEVRGRRRRQKRRARHLRLCENRVRVAQPLPATRPRTVSRTVRLRVAAAAARARALRRRNAPQEQHTGRRVGRVGV